MPVHRYDLRFGRQGGCPMTVLQDMARLDRATVLRVVSDTKCEPEHVRAATLIGAMAPTMERWATFVVGCSVTAITDTAAWPYIGRRQPASDAIEPKGPRS